MANISNKDIAEAIHQATKGKSGNELTATLKKVVQFLSRRRLISKEKEILSKLKEIINKEEGIVSAKITSVEKLHTNTKEKIIHSLKHRYAAHDVELEEETNEKVLGGIKIEVGDEVIDLTIKNKIKQLQEYLIKVA